MKRVTQQYQAPSAALAATRLRHATKPQRLLLVASKESSRPTETLTKKDRKEVTAALNDVFDSLFGGL